MTIGAALVLALALAVVIPAGFIAGWNLFRSVI